MGARGEGWGVGDAGFQLWNEEVEGVKGTVWGIESVLL